MKLLKLLVFLVFYFSIEASNDQVNPQISSNFVMIGNSKGNQKPIEKTDDVKTHHRSSYAPAHHHRPSSEYYHPGYYTPPQTPSGHQPSLISANVNLLEPFMLMTLLMFVVSLVEKVRFPSNARNEYIEEIPFNLTEVSELDERYNQYQQRFMKIINENWKRCA